MTQQRRHFNRRTFLGSSLAMGVGASLNATAIATSRTSRVLGANDRIRVGFIGVGNRGTQLLNGFMGFEDVQVAALCDVYSPYVQRDLSAVPEKLVRDLQGKVPKMDEKLPKDVSRFKDFRKLLEQKDIDAVVIATPDHWHAIQAIQACESGKDVYVEKPLTTSIVEGRRMVDVAAKTKRVVQVGLQRRSSKVYQTLPGVIQDGKIGKVSVARAYQISNMFPDGIGISEASEPPAELDWDMWLGPRAWRKYQENIHPYKFRWWSGYSSQVGNWGVHYFDAIRWALGERAPVSVSAHGGGFVLDDDRTIPDTMEVVFEFASGRLLIFGQYEASGGSVFKDGEIELRGTLGTIYSKPASYTIEHSKPGQFQQKSDVEKPSVVSLDVNEPTSEHIRNFLDCVKSRQRCNCSLEEGHRSTTFAHLANIALETKSRIEWDAESERIVNNDDANRLLHYEYRKPWTLG